MNTIVAGTLFLSLVVGFFIGWAFSLYRIAKDKNIHVLTDSEANDGITMHKLSQEEVACKKPPDGHVLVAVTPEIARKLVNLKNLSSEEMRSMIWNQVSQ